MEQYLNLNKGGEMDKFDKFCRKYMNEIKKISYQDPNLRIIIKEKNIFVIYIVKRIIILYCHLSLNMIV